MGIFSKPLATISLPKSPTFFGNLCKGVKIFNFSSDIIFGQPLKTFGDFLLVTLDIKRIFPFGQIEEFLQKKFITSSTTRPFSAFQRVASATTWLCLRSRGKGMGPGSDSPTPWRRLVSRWRTHPRSPELNVRCLVGVKRGVSQSGKLCSCHFSF